MDIKNLKERRSVKAAINPEAPHEWMYAVNLVDSPIRNHLANLIKIEKAIEAAILIDKLIHAQIALTEEEKEKYEYVLQERKSEEAYAERLVQAQAKPILQPSMRREELKEELIIEKTKSKSLQEEIAKQAQIIENLSEDWQERQRTFDTVLVETLLNSDTKVVDLNGQEIPLDQVQHRFSTIQTKPIDVKLKTNPGLREHLVDLFEQGFDGALTVARMDGVTGYLNKLFSLLPEDPTPQQILQINRLNKKLGQVFSVLQDTKAELDAETIRSLLAPIQQVVELQSSLKICNERITQLTKALNDPKLDEYKSPTPYKTKPNPKA